MNYNITFTINYISTISYSSLLIIPSFVIRIIGAILLINLLIMLL